MVAECTIQCDTKKEGDIYVCVEKQILVNTYKLQDQIGVHLHMVFRLSGVPIFPIFSYFFRFPIFFLYFNPISYFFHQIPIFFKMLQIKCIDVQYRALFSKTVNL